MEQPTTTAQQQLVEQTPKAKPTRTNPAQYPFTSDKHEEDEDVFVSFVSASTGERHGADQPPRPGAVVDL
jgi:hypothetical protein